MSLSEFQNTQSVFSEIFEENEFNRNFFDNNGDAAREYIFRPIPDSCCVNRKTAGSTKPGKIEYRFIGPNSQKVHTLTLHLGSTAHYSTVLHRLQYLTASRPI